MALIERTGDLELNRASERVLAKIAAAIPPPLRQALSSRALHAWGAIAPAPEGIDFGVIRRAVRNEEKLSLDYRDEHGRATRRTIRPLALIYYSEVAVFVAWCELRQAIRNFRVDRVVRCIPTGEHFQNEGDRLRRLWMAGWQTNHQEAVALPLHA